jgi:hypothetical protein
LCAGPNRARRSRGGAVPMSAALKGFEMPSPSKRSGKGSPPEPTATYAAWKIEALA